MVCGRTTTTSCCFQYSRGLETMQPENAKFFEKFFAVRVAPPGPPGSRRKKCAPRLAIGGKAMYIMEQDRDIAQPGLARLTGGQKVASSNLAIPTIFLPMRAKKWSTKPQGFTSPLLRQAAKTLHSKAVGFSSHLHKKTIVRSASLVKTLPVVACEDASLVKFPPSAG